MWFCNRKSFVWATQWVIERKEREGRTEKGISSDPSPLHIGVEQSPLLQNGKNGSFNTILWPLLLMKIFSTVLSFHFYEPGFHLSLFGSYFLLSLSLATNLGFDCDIYLVTFEAIFCCVELWFIRNEFFIARTWLLNLFLPRLWSFCS